MRVAGRSFLIKLKKRLDPYFFYIRSGFVSVLGGPFKVLTVFVAFLLIPSKLAVFLLC